jgi:hypothetical protein
MDEDVDFDECPHCEGDVAHEIVVELQVVHACVAGESGTAYHDQPQQNVLAGL